MSLPCRPLVSLWTSTEVGPFFAGSTCGSVSGSLKAQACRDLLLHIQDCLVGVLGAASVLLAGVDTITMRVDDVLIALNALQM